MHCKLGRSKMTAYWLTRDFFLAENLSKMKMLSCSLRRFHLLIKCIASFSFLTTMSVTAHYWHLKQANNLSCLGILLRR